MPTAPPDKQRSVASSRPASERMQSTATPGIFRRGSRYVVVVRDRSGKQFKRTARTMAQARDLKAQLQLDISRGMRAPERICFDTYVDEWVHTYQGRTSRGIRQVTLDRYAVHLEQAKSFFGNRQLADIGARDLKLYCTELAQRGLSNNSVRLHMAPLRAMLATAVEDGLLASNPAAGFRNVYGKRTQDSLKPKALSDAELARLIAAAAPEHRLGLALLAETGVRLSEFVALQWHDVDLNRGRLRIERRYSTDGFNAPKSRYGLRTIPLSQCMVAELSELKDCLRPAPGDPVFQTSRGTMLDADNFRRRIFGPAAKRAGLAGAYPHMLRHTCASRLFKAGWNAKQVQMMLGHHSPAFTMSVYVHLIGDDLPCLDALSVLAAESPPLA